ncbi:hypothetical protein D9757_006968 [Collybiopsis confluens]|uniref:Transmembrane protein n=1 Tax=Collybiopsis confluens TaxID=2823264 RepID=A0A8H5M7F6_9AGAR|nr:hypothetical protein D9757_006968 [Collybiopsis confluens]
MKSFLNSSEISSKHPSGRQQKAATMDVIFPSKGFQVLSCFIYITGVSILAHCLSRRISTERWTWSEIKEISWSRLCVLLVFFDSWLFLFTSCILVFGIGLESDKIVCALGIYLCVLFYATSKLLIYSFLVEKVYIVWSPSVRGGKRLRSPIYIGCLVMIGIYAIVIALMVVGKIHYLREPDGVCIIGLKRFSSLALLGYDLLINIALTLLFLWPILKADLTNPRLRRVAVRTMLASGVALTTSTINMLVLALLKGHERGWVCLGSCGADVIFNALAIFWVTKSTTHTPSPANVVSFNNNNNINKSSIRENRSPPGLEIIDGENLVMRLPASRQSALMDHDASSIRVPTVENCGKPIKATRPSESGSFTFLDVPSNHNSLSKKRISQTGLEIVDMEMQMIPPHGSINPPPPPSAAHHSTYPAISSLFRTDARSPDRSGVHIMVTTNTVTDQKDSESHNNSPDTDTESFT